MSEIYEVQAGNGRLFKVTAEEKAQKAAQLEELRMAGKSWATDDKIPVMSGYFQVSHELVAWFTYLLNKPDAATPRGGLLSVRWSALKALDKQNVPYLKVEKMYGQRGSLSFPDFVKNGGANAVAKEPVARVEERPQQPVDFDDDIPF